MGIDVDRLWGQVLEVLRPELDPGEFDTWLRPLRPRSDGDRGLLLEVQNRQVLAYVEAHHRERLAELLAAHAGGPVPLTLRSAGGTGELFPPARPPRTDAAVLDDVPLAPAGDPLVPRYRFETFVVGPSNQLADAAARAVATRPASQYNPLFIYGGTGLGKTHLIQAVGHHLMERNPSVRVRYMTCETYINDWIQAVQRKTIDAFRVRYRRPVDLWIVDDVQFLEGKESTQNEFFHTFNALYGAGVQVVFSSDRFPRDILKLEDRLRSRFQWGLVADIKPPEKETRIAILRKKAAAAGIALPDDVVDYVATRITSNVRELESCLVRLHLESNLQAAPVDLRMTKDALRTQVKKSTPHVTAEQIMNLVAERFDVTRADLCSERRMRSFSQPRQIAMYLCRRILQLSFPELGERFGGRDHSTVLTSFRKIEQQRKQDSELSALLDELERKLRGGTC
ncbi:MAG: chromosomal replication initiator protein DnaA [Deltaproteobacteria bacterium]|nr:chromosomal replication initiator protein DnaA [Deltaproteobacteria bacterium]